MTARKSPTRHATGRAQRLTQAWAAAGVIGMTLAVTIVIADPFPNLAAATTALLAVACGWIAMLLFAPWRAIGELKTKRRLVRDTTRRLRHLDTGGRDWRLRDLILDRDDELGELSRAIHDTIAQALIVRRETRLLQRTMDDAIRKETDRATVRLQRQAATDALTGLGNRRTLEAKLAELFASDRRRRRDNVVAMAVDLDMFKAVNDTLGHEVGDACLVFLGRLLTSALRREDCAIRLGGDEFIVLMPNQDVDEAKAAADRIRALFNQMPWPHRAQPRPTLSVGLATAWSGDPNGAEDLLRRADAALYRSKRVGRNTVTTCEDLRTVA